MNFWLQGDLVGYNVGASLTYNLMIKTGFKFLSCGVRNEK